MNQRDEIELRRFALLKAARSAVRLRHSLAADEELNSLLPLLEQEFNRRVQSGALPEVATLLRENRALHDA